MEWRLILKLFVSLGQRSNCRLLLCDLIWDGTCSSQPFILSSTSLWLNYNFSGSIFISFHYFYHEICNTDWMFCCSRPFRGVFLFCIGFWFDARVKSLTMVSLWVVQLFRSLAGTSIYRKWLGPRTMNAPHVMCGSIAFLFCLSSLLLTFVHIFCFALVFLFLCFFPSRLSAFLMPTPGFHVGECTRE